MAPWQTALAKLKRGTLVVDFFDQTDGSSLIAASDIVVADYSTMLCEAAMLRKPAISLWYPEVRKSWDSTMKGCVPIFPLISMGCVLKAESREDLAQESDARTLADLERAQCEHFPNMEKSAVRAANFIHSLL